MGGSKIKKILCIVLTIVLVAAMFMGCSKETNETVNDTSSEEKEDINNEKSNIESKKTEGKKTETKDTEIDSDIATLPKFDVEEDKVVTVLTHWVHPKADSDNMDLWPGEKRLLKKIYDVDVEYVKMAAGEIPTKHAAMVMAGDPADVVNLAAYADYPYSFTNGLYEPLDDLMPLDSEVFDVVRKYIDILRVNGKAYWAPTIVRPSPPNLIYNKTLLEEAGLEDPWELVEKNEWTWDTFFEYCKELTVDRDGDGIVDQYGASAVRNFLNAMVNSLGYPISKIDDNNNVEINLRDEGLMDYYEFLKKVSPFGEGVFHPLSFKQGDATQKIEEEFLNGNIAFYYGWSNGKALSSVFRPMFEKNELGEAILPKHPDADKQYVGVSVSGMGISKGAKHPNTAAAYITTYISRVFESTVEVIEDSNRIVSNKEKEMGVDLLSFYSDSKYKCTKADIYDSLYVQEVPVDTLDYCALGAYITNKYIKDYPDCAVFDFGQFATLTNYLAFEKIFSGDENGNPVTAQQIIEEIEPQMQEKIDKFEKAINNE